MDRFLQEQVKKQHCANLEDFYAAIGYGGVLLSRIMPRMKEDYLKLVKAEEILLPEQVVNAPRKHRNSGGRRYRRDGQLPGQVRPLLQPGPGG